MNTVELRSVIFVNGKPASKKLMRAGVPLPTNQFDFPINDKDRAMVACRQVENYVNRFHLPKR